MRKTFVCSMGVLLLVLGSLLMVSTTYGNHDTYLKSWEYHSYHHFKTGLKMHQSFQAYADAMFSASLKKPTNIRQAIDISSNRRDKLKGYAEQYKPSLQFKDGEPYFPCDFYFDHDTYVGNNRDNYPRNLNEKFDKLRYFVHIQESVRGNSISEPAIVIEYWYYYVADTTEGRYRGHEHDWESFIIFLKQTDPSKVLLLKVGQHGKLIKNNWENVEKENTTHTRLYVDYKHAMLYHASWNGPKVPYNKPENKPTYVWDSDAVQGRDGDYDYIPNWEGYHVYGDWDPRSKYWWASNYSGGRPWPPIVAAWRKVSWMMPEEGMY